MEKLKFEHEKKVIAYLKLFGIRPTAPGGVELMALLCTVLEHQDRLKDPEEILYSEVAGHFGISAETLRDHASQLLEKSMSTGYIRMFLAIDTERAALWTFLKYSVLYLTYTDESNSTDNIGTVRNAFIIDPAEMNDSQKLSYMYYFATFMPREIDGYLILPTDQIKDYDNDFVNQARKCFIQGMANVIVRLRCGADKEIAAGIELISADLAQGNLSAFCIDPLGFYKRMKAIAAICRVYYMGIDDKIISIHIFQSDIEYPHLHFSALCTNQLPKWFQEAIQLSSKLMGTDISEKDIKRCVLDSFPNETAWKAWMINARYTAPEYVQLGPEAGDENASFIFRVSPITALDDPYIETLLQAVARKHPAKFGRIEG